VGELSLLANRPLWYSLVVASPTARVVAINLQALRGVISAHLSLEAQEKWVLGVRCMRACFIVDLQLRCMLFHCFIVSLFHCFIVDLQLRCMRACFIVDLQLLLLLPLCNNTSAALLPQEK